MTKDEAHSICRNDIRYRITLFLYNGVTIHCCPISFDFNEDYLLVSVIGPEKSNVEIRRDIIYRYEPIIPSLGQVRNIVDVSPTFSGEYAKKLIIIGAGASYGYSNQLTGERKSFRPPLANGIFAAEFDNLLNDFRGAKNFATSTYSVADIEGYFQGIWNRIADQKRYELASIYSLINTQYYLSALFLQISEIQKGNRHNHYQQLIQLIDEYVGARKNEKILIVSFNYDLLLEEALSAYKLYQYDDLDDYVDYLNRDILLFKPHGSCNWFKKINGLPTHPNKGRLQASLIETAKHIFNSKMHLGELSQMLSDELFIINDEPRNGFAYHNEYYPQLLVPFKDKDDFSMPSGHTTILKYLLRHIEDVLVIGWKGTETKFNNLLKTELAGKPLKFYYANHTDSSIKDTYSKILPKSDIIDFKDFFPNIEGQKWNRANADFGTLISYSTVEKNFFFQ